MFCPNCGKPLDDGVKFCPNCGSPAPQAAPADTAPALTISQDNMVLALRVVCGVLGAIFVLFALKGAFDLVRVLLSGLISLF